MKNYYLILEVRQNATPDEIKKSYRRLAMQYHPDRNPGNKHAEEKFKEIANAYEVLGNPLKKAYYDRQLYIYQNPHQYTAQNTQNTQREYSYSRNASARAYEKRVRDEERSRRFKMAGAIFLTMLFINSLRDGGCNNRNYPQYDHVNTIIINGSDTMTIEEYLQKKNGLNIDSIKNAKKDSIIFFSD